MTIKNIYNVYFSPTGGTEKIAVALSDKLSQLLHIPSQTHLSYWCFRYMQAAYQTNYCPIWKNV